MDLGVELGIIGIAIGALSLALGLMALPTVFQMFCGRPEIVLATDEFTGSDGARQLYITMRNKVITKRWLTCLGVERETGEVMASFSIRDQGTGKYLANGISGHLNSVATREHGLVLRAMPGHTVGFPIIHHRTFGPDKESKAWVVDARATNLLEQVIPNGDYVVEAFIFRGQKVYPVTKTFRVRSKAHETIWTS